MRIQSCYRPSRIERNIPDAAGARERREIRFVTASILSVRSHPLQASAGFQQKLWKTLLKNSLRVAVSAT
jgi:hypothetical protein